MCYNCFLSGILIKEQFKNFKLTSKVRGKNKTRKGFDKPQKKISSPSGSIFFSALSCFFFNPFLIMAVNFKFFSLCLIIIQTQLLSNLNYHSFHKSSSLYKHLLFVLLCFNCLFRLLQNLTISVFYHYIAGVVFFIVGGFYKLPEFLRNKKKVRQSLILLKKTTTAILHNASSIIIQKKSFIVFIGFFFNYNLHYVKCPSGVFF